MAEPRVLHAIFTMDCQPAATRAAPEGPKSWEQSARAIDGFCMRLLGERIFPTLFVSPRCAEEHAPSLEELGEAGVEIGLLVQPRSLESGSYRRHLGQYGRDEQREIVRTAMAGLQDALGTRPQSIRSDLYSASDDTFAVVYELGFRQGSISCPGRFLTPHGAQWIDAEPDPHYVDPANRLRAGDLPFFEVPLTADRTQRRGGLSPDLTIENGTFEKWHRPLIEGQLQRMEADDVGFRALCISTRNCFSYHDRADRYRAVLDGLVGYIESLGDAYDVRPTTLAGAHAAYRALARAHEG